MKISPTWQIRFSLPDKFMDYFDQNDAQLDWPINRRHSLTNDVIPRKVPLQLLQYLLYNN